MNMHKNYTYKQISGSIKFLVIGIIVALYFFTSITFIIFYKNERIQADTFKLEQVSIRLNDYFKFVEHHSRLLVGNDQIQAGSKAYYKYLNKLSGIEKISMGLAINKIIYPLTYIHTVSIYDRNKNIIISSENKEKPTPFSLDKTSEGIWLLSEKYDRSEKNLLNTLSYVRPFFDYHTGNFLGFIEISIAENAIQELYMDENSDSYYIIVDKYGNLQMQSQNHSVPKNLLNAISLRLAKGEKLQGFIAYNIINSRRIESLGWNFINITPWYVFIKPGLIIAFLFLFTAIVCIFISILISDKFAKEISIPISALIEHTNYIKNGNWDTLNFYAKNSDIEHLIEEFNSMILAQHKLQSELIQTEKAKNKLNLKLMNEQINPHFLYNTLDNIYSLAELDEKEILLELVMNLSNFYRSVLNKGYTFVSIKEELENLENYLKIMQVRYMGKFVYTISCPENLYEFSCPKLILQPPVENSIYHGIKYINELGQIDIILHDNDTDISFEIRDNGRGLVDKNKESDNIHSSKNNFALKHIKQILNIYYGADYGLELSNSDNGGCICKFKIKKEFHIEN